MKKERWPLESTCNTRDLGGYPLPEGGVTADRAVRSDYFQVISPKDQQTLLESGVKLVIDLRDGGEAENTPSVFAGGDGVRYRRISLMPSDTVQKLDFEKTEGGYHFLMGDAYLFILDERQAQLAEVFRCMLSEAEGKVFFHCSAGKDRTGVTAALLLLLAGAAEEDVVRDYALTESLLAPIIPKIMEMAGDELDEDMTKGVLGSPPENMERMIAYLKEKYGGAEAYLTHIGLSAEEIQGLRRLMS